MDLGIVDVDSPSVREVVLKSAWSRSVGRSTRFMESWGVALALTLLCRVLSGLRILLFCDIWDRVVEVPLEENCQHVFNGHA